MPGAWRQRAGRTRSMFTAGPGALHALLPGGSLRAGYVYSLTVALRAVPRWSWSAASLPYVAPTSAVLGEARGAFLPGIPLPQGLGATLFYRTRAGRVEPGGGPYSLPPPASPLPAFLYAHLPPLQGPGGCRHGAPARRARPHHAVQCLHQRLGGSTG